MSDTEKRYLIYIDLRDNSKARIRESLTALNEIMRTLFQDNFKLVTTSNDASALSFLVKTAMHAHAINTALMSPERRLSNFPGDPLTTSDRLMILELGEQRSTFGLNVVDGWLNSH